jgi:putative membrane protein
MPSASINPNEAESMLVRFMTGATALYWCAMAIAPLDRATWLLENMMTLVGVTLLVVFWRSRELSPTSMAMALAFLALHTTGAHYTYSLVPYDAWAQTVFGHSIADVTGWQRNHYDRLVHFACGLLLANPWYDWLIRTGRATQRTAWWITLLIVTWMSHVYELIEWVAAEIFGGDLGAAYLGTQGDPWDAQKDMALAMLGAFIGVAIALILRTSPTPSRASG